MIWNGQKWSQKSIQVKKNDSKMAKMSHKQPRNGSEEV